MEYSFNKLICDPMSNNYGDFLIVTADDFGYDGKRDQAILECFRNGIVTRASLLVNGASANSSAVRLAHDNNLTLGLHLNLSEGSPVFSGKSSLTDERGLFRGKFGLRDAVKNRNIDMTDIRKEVTAQIKLFNKLVGYKPNYIDGHQHVHVLPGIQDIVAQVMHDNSIFQIRIPLENNVLNRSGENKDFYEEVVKDSRDAMHVYGKHNIRFPDKFIGISLMGKYMSVQGIMKAITEAGLGREKKSGSSFCELMVHPGYVCTDSHSGCGDGPDAFARSPDREHEAGVLQMPELKQFLQENNITLIA